MIANRQQTCSIFGLTRAEFDRLVALGLPGRKKTASRGEDWACDTVEVHRWLVEAAVSAAGLVAAGQGALDPDQERARKDRALADRTELEVRRLKGELLDRATLERALATMDRTVIDRLTLVGQSCAAEALDAGQRLGVVGVAAVVDGRIRDALAALAAAEVVSSTAKRAAG